ncbi:MAG: pilin [Oscillospiraceae bacterium]|nr:pilin [Oscillospiraceae bacterium]
MGLDLQGQRQGCSRGGLQDKSEKWSGRQKRRLVLIPTANLSPVAAAIYRRNTGTNKEVIVLKRTEIASGFTLLELMVVIAIVGVLAAVLIPSLTKYIRRAQVTTDVTNAKSIYEATQLVMMLHPAAYEEVMTVGQDNKGGFKPADSGVSDITGKESQIKRQTVAKMHGTRSGYGNVSAYATWTLENNHHTDTFCKELNDSMCFTAKSAPNAQLKCVTHTATGNRNIAKNSGGRIITDRWCVARVTGTDVIEVWVCSSYGQGGGQYGIYRIWPSPDIEYNISEID